MGPVSRRVAVSASGTSKGSSKTRSRARSTASAVRIRAVAESRWARSGILTMGAFRRGRSTAAQTRSYGLVGPFPERPDAALFMATQRAIGFPLGGYVMRGFWARLMVVGITVVGAARARRFLVAVADSARPPQFRRRSVRCIVRVYSLMCDGHGAAPPYATEHQEHVVEPADGASSWTPSRPRSRTTRQDVIDPGMGTLVHLTSSRSTPAHNATVIAGTAQGHGADPEVAVPIDPDHGSHHQAHHVDVEADTSTSKPTTTSGPYVPPTRAGRSRRWAAGRITGNRRRGWCRSRTRGRTSAAKAASGTLPFTGSDIRGFALLGDLMVLIGFAMLLISHRSPR